MEFNEEHIESLLKDLSPHRPHRRRGRRRLSPSKTTLRRRTPSPLMMTLNRTATLQQKDVNLEDTEKMKIEEDDSDSEDEGPLGQPALPQEQTFASLGRATTRS
ncbi:hypothetical protein E4U19_003688 [Claviceps sp. Clav32 group G5]|nr:hypothetical protein E4U19_003688 [Claviceps sp. Clav32 group G5]